MSNFIKKLAGQTAVYGLSSMVGRFINFLLTPLLTAQLAGVEEYGTLSVLYTYIAFSSIFLSYGTETAYFYFCKNTDNKKSIFNIIFSSLLFTTLLLCGLGFIFKSEISYFVGYKNIPHIIGLTLIILGADTLSSIPFAKLRQENKAIKFALIKLSGILLNVALVLYLLLACPWLIAKGYTGWFTSIYSADSKLYYVFLSNVISSLWVLLLLSPVWIKAKITLNISQWKEIMKYAWPFIFIGFAGIANETLDRILLKNRLSPDVSEYQIGIYSAFYKLSMIMTMFVQAFRYAAEPFFFEISKNKDSKKQYALVFKYFLYVVCSIGILTLGFLNILAPIFIRKSAYFAAQNWVVLVAILLFANLFLGIYYNLSAWYKLAGKPKIGAKIAIIGAIFTAIANYLLIPKYGYMASAVITLLTYFGMSVISYLWSKKYYPIPYNISFASKLILLTSLVGIGIIYLMTHNNYSNQFKNIVGISVSIFYCLCLFLVAKKQFTSNG